MDNLPIKDKRDILLAFHSSPDALLNALHQGGWVIIPQSELKYLRERVVSPPSVTYDRG